jgi:hypothetical protein
MGAESEALLVWTVVVMPGQRLGYALLYSTLPGWVKSSFLVVKALCPRSGTKTIYTPLTAQNGLLTRDPDLNSL